MTLMELLEGAARLAIGAAEYSAQVNRTDPPPDMLAFAASLRAAGARLRDEMAMASVHAHDRIVHSAIYDSLYRINGGPVKP